MIIAFFGHRFIYNFEGSIEILEKEILENIREVQKVVFYLGGYGDFDALCLRACRSVKKKREGCEIVFITPYRLEGKTNFEKESYDLIVYPPIENIPRRYAILWRNRWMADQADLIFSYVTHTYGGAFQAIEYAKRSGKRIIAMEDKCKAERKTEKTIDL